MWIQQLDTPAACKFQDTHFYCLQTSIFCTAMDDRLSNNSPIFNWLALQELHSNVSYIFLPFWQVSHLSLITFKACYYLDVLIYLKEVFVLLTLTVQTWFMLCQLLTICWRQRHSSQGPCGTYAGPSPHQKLGKKAFTSVLAFYRVVFSQMGFDLELHRPISYGNPRLSEHAE